MPLVTQPLGVFATFAFGHGTTSFPVSWWGMRVIGIWWSRGASASLERILPNHDPTTRLRRHRPGDAHRDGVHGVEVPVRRGGARFLRAPPRPGAGPRSSAARSRAPARTVRVVADALVGLGVLARGPERYGNSPAAQARLATPDPDDLRPVLRLFDRISYRDWGELGRAVRTGRARARHVERRRSERAVGRRRSADAARSGGARDGVRFRVATVGYWTWAAERDHFSSAMLRRASRIFQER